MTFEEKGSFVSGLRVALGQWARTAETLGTKPLSFIAIALDAIAFSWAFVITFFLPGDLASSSGLPGYHSESSSNFSLYFLGQYPTPEGVAVALALAGEGEGEVEEVEEEEEEETRRRRRRRNKKKKKKKKKEKKKKKKKKKRKKKKKKKKKNNKKKKNKKK